MPWYAQRADLPDTHKLWADADSVLEATYVRLGYVEVPAPGAEPVEVLNVGGLVPGGAPVGPVLDAGYVVTAAPKVQRPRAKAKE